MNIYKVILFLLCLGNCYASEYLLEVTQPLPKTDEILMPFSMAFSTNFLYVFDLQTKQITMYDNNFKLIKKFAGNGQGPSEFSGPTHLEVNGNSLYAYDVFTRKTVEFALNGEFVRAFKGLNSQEMIKPLDGKFYSVSKTGKHYIITSSSTLEPTNSVDFKTEHQIGKYSFGLIFTNAINGGIITGDFDKYRLDIYSPTGTHLKTAEKPYKPIGPIFYSSMNTEIILPVVVGLVTVEDKYLALIGGMQNFYESAKGNKIDDEYLLHIDIFDQDLKPIGRTWNKKISNKNSVFGYPLFKKDLTGALWICPDFFDGDIFRCQLVKADN